MKFLYMTNICKWCLQPKDNDGEFCVHCQEKVSSMKSHPKCSICGEEAVVKIESIWLCNLHFESYKNRRKV